MHPVSRFPVFAGNLPSSARTSLFRTLLKPGGVNRRGLGIIGTGSRIWPEVMCGKPFENGFRTVHPSDRAFRARFRGFRTVGWAASPSVGKHLFSNGCANGRTLNRIFRSSAARTPRTAGLERGTVKARRSQSAVFPTPVRSLPFCPSPACPSGVRSSSSPAQASAVFFSHRRPVRLGVVGPAGCDQVATGGGSATPVQVGAWFRSALRPGRAKTNRRRRVRRVRARFPLRPGGNNRR